MSKRSALAAGLMGNLERSGMASAETGQGRRIISDGPGSELGERTQAAGNDECGTTKKVAAADRFGAYFSSINGRHGRTRSPEYRGRV